MHRVDSVSAGDHRRHSQRGKNGTKSRASSHAAPSKRYSNTAYQPPSTAAQYASNYQTSYPYTDGSYADGYASHAMPAYDYGDNATYHQNYASYPLREEYKILPLTLHGTRTNPRINRMLTHLYPGILIRAHTPRPHNSPGCSSRAPCQLLHLLYRPCFSTLLTKQIFVSVFFPCASPWPFVETIARSMNCLHVMIKNLNPIIEIDRALVSRTL